MHICNVPLKGCMFKCVCLSDTVVYLLLWIWNCHLLVTDMVSYLTPEGVLNVKLQTRNSNK